jgi:predicted lipase
MVGKVGDGGAGPRRRQGTMADNDGAAPNWAAIREEYEGRRFVPATICKRYGITPAQLRYRRQVEGWLSASARAARQDGLVARMLKVLDKQIRRLEMAVNEPIEKQANVLSTSVKTLDKLIELGAAERNVEPATKKDMTDLRDKLAKRIDQFKNR